MGQSIERHLDKNREYRVLELGSRNPRETDKTHRAQFAGYRVKYLGVDLLEGHNVDVVMTRPYTIPVPPRSADVVIAGSVFEHVPFVWATVLEIGRVLRVGGLLFVSAPSRGHEHNVYDCWRYYPDGYRALAAWAGIELLEVFADLPPRLPNSNHHDYAAIDNKHSYWGDSVAVLRRPTRGYPSIKLAGLRLVTKLWANANPDLERIPRPREHAARRAVHQRA
jgi:SAM-dependent methyltransferase